MVAGRPPEYDRMDVARRLLEWAKTDDAVNINKFCALHCDPPMPVLNLSKWANESDEFRISYDAAKSFLAFRREEKLGSDQLHVKAYDLNASVYDLTLREEKRDQMRFEADLKAKIEVAISEGDLKRHDDLMSQLALLQSQRKIASKTRIKDKKS